ncbi:hypothetical protein EGR_10699 [Echinococcus granulosus]|uniref:Uncharacterized protein n=1 Tax=Echinococcus granulosus TaxID=6210 RepID=W6U1M8_ECHGR|nr:hypothetical protein EGR_10699 [Echinococcus granulosus]EUB54436.1 hypothetical protein EGR_10699 [Echinococcus granulosus]
MITFQTFVSPYSEPLNCFSQFKKEVFAKFLQNEKLLLCKVSYAPKEFYNHRLFSLKAELDHLKPMWPLGVMFNNEKHFPVSTDGIFIPTFTLMLLRLIACICTAQLTQRILTQQKTDFNVDIWYVIVRFKSLSPF